MDKVNISILNFVCPQTFLSVSWVRLSGEARHGFSSQMPASRCKTNELISNGYTCWKRKVNDPRKFTETVLWCSRLKPKMEKHNAINQKNSNREIGLVRKKRKRKKKLKNILHSGQTAGMQLATSNRICRNVLKELVKRFCWDDLHAHYNAKHDYEKPLQSFFFHPTLAIYILGTALTQQ